MKIEANISHKLIFEAKDRFLIIYGGAGSGKSVATAQKILLRILSEENHRIVIARKIARTLRVSVFQLFKDLISDLGLFNDFKINKSDMTITYKENKSQLLFFGLDNIERLKSIQGITSIWIEEASECNEGDILELNRRLRGETKYYKQIILTFNPISHLHWLKSHFFDTERDDVSIFKTTYKDNAFIDEEYKQQLEAIKEYDEQQYRIYALGEWGVLNENIIHHRFKPLEHISDKTIKDFDSIQIGVDFNIGGCVGVVHAEDDNGISHFIDEFVSYDTEQMILDIKARYIDKDIVIYPDASGGNRSTNSKKSDIDMLREHFRVIAPKSNSATSIRYNACNRRLSLNNILVNNKACKKLYNALQVHAYTDKGLPEKFNDHKGGAIDDYTDAFGYVIGRLYPISYSKIERKALSYG